MGVDQRFGLLEHDGSTIFGGLVCCIAELPQLVILYFMEVNVMVHKVQVYCHSAAIMFMKVNSRRINWLDKVRFGEQRIKFL